MRLAYKLYSPKQGVASLSPIIILHGLLGNKSNWQSIARHLANSTDRAVYTLDARNHGKSPHAHEHTYTVMAEDVRQFTQSHGIKPVVIGHSMGAKTGMVLALSYPTSIDGLIAVDHAPIVASITADFLRYFRCMKDIQGTPYKKLSEVDHLLKQYVDEFLVRQWLLSNAIREHGVLQWRIPLDVLRASLPALGDFPAPSESRYMGKTLFIKGSGSEYITDDMVPQIKRYFPGSVMRTLDAGHWVQVDQPEQFKSVCTDFLRDTTTMT